MHRILKVVCFVDLIWKSILKGFEIIFRSLHLEVFGVEVGFVHEFILSIGYLLLYIVAYYVSRSIVSVLVWF